MGKATKQKKAKARFDPLARPSSTAMSIDDEAPPKALSAHQERHLERKRLQREAEALKKQRGKVSKADKLAHSVGKKSITNNLKAVKAAQAACAPFSMTTFRFQLFCSRALNAQTSWIDVPPCHRLRSMPLGTSMATSSSTTPGSAIQTSSKFEGFDLPMPVAPSPR